MIAMFFHSWIHHVGVGSRYYPCLKGNLYCSKLMQPRYSRGIQAMKFKSIGILEIRKNESGIGKTPGKKHKHKNKENLKKKAAIQLACNKSNIKLGESFKPEHYKQEKIAVLPKNTKDMTIESTKNVNSNFNRKVDSFLYNVQPKLKRLAALEKISGYLFDQTFPSFCTYCQDLESIPVELCNILAKSSITDVNRLLPYFVKHASLTVPNIKKKKISSFTLPNVNSRSGGQNVEKVQQSLKHSKKVMLDSLIKPVSVKSNVASIEIDVGKELAGSLDDENLIIALANFYRRKEIRQLASENGIDNELFRKVFLSFRSYCKESDNLPAELHILLSDILYSAAHVDNLFPYFLEHATNMFPHLHCKEDLEKVSDLRLPANWYQEARSMKRKIVYHAGPTNSGKTYHALKRFYDSNSGVYCGPLRMLANEVFYKSNKAGTPCDLVTGEERKCVNKDEEPADHLSCTVEMASTIIPYEVAIIDEIQMIRDSKRGWAWTRALLGLCADEVHLCGESSAIRFVRELTLETGDDLEVHHYERLTKLTVSEESLDSLKEVQPGDCIVCFSKSDIYSVSRELERNNIESAVIYGTLPPGSKLYQAQRFNDPNDPCNVMVATDAIGMGINLNIKRVIFYSLTKPTHNENGKLEMDTIPPSMALQIAGRAGRYGTEHDEGEVTTFKAKDLTLLKELLAKDIEPVEQGGLQPTADQVELFSYHLPDATLSNIIDIFVTLAKIDDEKYFMCNVDDFKFLADMIEHIKLPLRTRYVLCCAPIPKKQTFVCVMFVKIARMFSEQQPITFNWMAKTLEWPFKEPHLITDLAHLEGVFDVLDIYLWLSYRFPDMFTAVSDVCAMQEELEGLIRNGVANITSLVKNSEIPIYTSVDQEEKIKVYNLFEKDTNTYETKDKSVHNVKDHTPLAEQLIKKGTLTRNMIEKLKKEFAKFSGNKD